MAIDPVTVTGSRGDTATYSSPKDFVGSQFNTLEEAEAFFAGGGTSAQAMAKTPGYSLGAPTVASGSSTPSKLSSGSGLSNQQVAQNLGISEDQAKDFQDAFAGGAQTSPQQTGAQAQQAAQSGTLTMPPSGSVVDLLNMAGQDSSFAARKQLAAQYGIQNYTGTAAQNTELSKKFLEAHNSLKGSAVPQTAAEARSALLGLSQTQTGQGTPTQQFYDAYSNLDPVTKSVYDTIQQTLSSINNRTSLQEELMKLPEWQERMDVKTELLDVKRIMEGTEDDIRDEITAAGGFATESQVQAMTTARNKTLLKQANALTDQFNVLNDYINQVTDLTKADREQVSKDLETKLGLTTTLFNMTQQMKNAERENYQRIIDEVGYGGLAQMVANNPAQARAVESALGLSVGQINSLASYKKPMNEMEVLQLENQRLQNQKLRQDISKNAEDPVNKYLSQAMQQQTIADTDKLLSAPGLNSAVGPNDLSRTALMDAFGAKSAFIAGVEQLRGQLTLDNLIQAKGSGATFGALSDTELKMIAASASKLGTWALKDDSDNVIGYQIDEKSFKKELDTINYFQKLDYILKGGEPSSVGAVQMADGTYWVQNSDGSFRKL